jgi:hypothetical protein
MYGDCVSSRLSLRIGSLTLQWQLDKSQFRKVVFVLLPLLGVVLLFREMQNLSGRIA